MGRPPPLAHSQLRHPSKVRSSAGYRRVFARDLQSRLWVKRRARKVDISKKVKRVFDWGPGVIILGCPMVEDKMTPNGGNT